MPKEAIERAELEQPRTREEMQSLIKVLCDPSAFSDKEVHLREGIVKPMLEEYCPLWALMVRFPGAKARLTKASHNGPDAVIISEDGTETTLQIVTAYTSYQEALGREMLADNKGFFPTRLRTRNHETKTVEETKGRGVTVPSVRIAKVVTQIESALQKKIKNFKPNTDALLICSQVALVDGVWKEKALDALANTPGIPYKRVFVCDNDSLYIDYAPPALPISGQLAS